MTALIGRPFFATLVVKKALPAKNPAAAKPKAAIMPKIKVATKPSVKPADKPGTKPAPSASGPPSTGK